MPSFTVFKGSKDGSIVESTTSKPDQLTGDLVQLKVTASGLCGTDLHYRNADMVLGHEGVGIVEAIGPDVKYLKKGDRVGWGYVHDTCGQCQHCLSGRETRCPQRQMYGEADLDQGSMASGAVWREAFLFKVPDELSDEIAAPLMCGGATVFNALRALEAQGTETVGIMGVGGLGHLAIQYAARMGCNVVVLSGSDRKKDEAMKLGAKEFIATKGAKELNVSRPLDRLIVTTSVQPDWSLILPIMSPGATIVPISIAGGNLEIPYLPLVVQELRIQGSVVAARYFHNQMLEFSALHNIAPIIEKFPLTAKGITEAMKKLDSGDMRYRGVLLPQ